MPLVRDRQRQAHLYGFSSADSDVDLRGAFVLPLQDVLRLRTPEETLAIAVQAGMEIDWVAHDVTKFARLMTRRNGYVLEQLYSPLVVFGGPWLDELRQWGAVLSRGISTTTTAAFCGTSSRRSSVRMLGQGFAVRVSGGTDRDSSARHRRSGGEPGHAQRVGCTPGSRS